MSRRNIQHKGRPIPELDGGSEPETLKRGDGKKLNARLTEWLRKRDPHSSRRRFNPHGSARSDS